MHRQLHGYILPMSVLRCITHETAGTVPRGSHPLPRCRMQDVMHCNNNADNDEQLFKCKAGILACLDDSEHFAAECWITAGLVQLLLHVFEMLWRSFHLHVDNRGKRSCR